jgi:hypothetical protein
MQVSSCSQNTERNMLYEPILMYKPLVHTIMLCPKQVTRMRSWM